MQTTIVPQMPGRLSRLPRYVERQLDDAHYEALLEASHIEDVHFVARIAQTAVVSLTDAEEHHAKSSPLAGVRLMAVGDAATSAIVAAVLRTGRRW